VLPVRQTEQVLLEIVREAQERLTILSFGIFQVPRIVSALEDALNRRLRVRIILGERESQIDLTQESQRRELGGPIMERASVYYWPPEHRLRDDLGRPGLMHVKVAVADARTLLLSSANLTESALERNMELGVLLKGGDAASRVERHVDALVTAGHLALVVP
jgi:phosphatidylserine/phosphatidylglycerophosphate/cardiolipin synthase-like enzyme